MLRLLVGFALQDLQGVDGDESAKARPAIDHQGALGSILLNLSSRDVFFIDEIHRLNSVVEESLYPALEDFRFDAVLGKGVGASAATP